MRGITKRAGHGRFRARALRGEGAGEKRRRGEKESDPSPFLPFSLSPFLAWVLLMLLVCLPGCRGCNKTPEQIEAEKKLAEEQETKKKKEEEKKPFEALLPPESLPAGIMIGRAGNLCKPGHWTGQSWHDVKSNLGDFQGEVQTEVVDSKLARVQLPNVPYRISDERPAALAKAQPKTLESCFWVPPKASSVNFKLATTNGVAAIDQSMMLRAMPSYQYFFVVLSRGGRFGYLNDRLDSIRLHQPPTSERGPDYYEVVTMQSNRRPALPASALCWTSIAYLLWDDSDPALWDLDQQQALVDWLHWGGQIIVSGPDALEQLQNSFLRPYLPATVKKARTFGAKDLDGLNYWAVEDGVAPRPKQPWPGAELQRSAKAEDVPSTPANMVVERRVGRGRIVVTAFRITGPEFTSWSGCDCFFNACLLRRGPREFSKKSLTGENVVRWAEARGQVPSTQYAVGRKSGASLNVAKGTMAGGESAPATATSRENGTLKNAAMNTTVRFFSRDAGVPFKDYASDIAERQAVNYDQYGIGPTTTGFDATQESAVTDGESDDSGARPTTAAVRRGLAPGTIPAPWLRPLATRSSWRPGSTSRSGVSSFGSCSVTFAFSCRPIGSFSARSAASNGPGSRRP